MRLCLPDACRHVRSGGGSYCQRVSFQAPKLSTTSPHDPPVTKEGRGRADISWGANLREAKSRPARGLLNMLAIAITHRDHPKR